jgi:histidinol phosphatase-like PHP family hydrolase
LHLLETKRSLTELAGVGPFIEKTILGWIDKPPGRVRVADIRRGFLTLVEARRILNRKHPPFPKGDLQMHSVWSDGAGTIPVMAEAGRALGYEYIGITDHSKGLKIAGGIDEAALRRQREEIRATNEGLLSAGFRVLAGIEMNLNPRGEGDMESAALTELDFVVGSFHSKLRVKEDQTERYLAAIRNPDIQILGHPRGRIYNFRIGLTADWPRVFAEAAKWDKAVEIDAYPDRQDLNVELVKMARDAGAKLAIDTDAHNPDQLAFVELGLAAAMSVNFPIERIINYLPADRLLAWVNGVRDKGGRKQAKRKILTTN